MSTLLLLLTGGAFRSRIWNWLSWFYAVPHRKCRDTNRSKTATFHILYNSLLNNQSTRYSWATDSIFKPTNHTWTRNYNTVPNIRHSALSDTAKWLLLFQCVSYRCCTVEHSLINKICTYIALPFNFRFVPPPPPSHYRQSDHLSIPFTSDSRDSTVTKKNSS
jgi:hypothetical protein